MALFLTTFERPFLKSELFPSFSHLITRKQPKRLEIGGFTVRASYYPIEDPIIKEPIKEPVAFMSGTFVGFLRIDLNDDPVKEWLTRTVEASEITVEEIETVSSKGEEDVPQQTEIG